MIIFSLGFTFSLASGHGEETGIDSLSVPGAGALGSVRSTRGITVSVSDSFRDPGLKRRSPSLPQCLPQ